MAATPGPTASRYCAPSRVSTLRRPSRVNSCTPRCSSSRAMARLTAPWVTCRSSAAREKLPRRAAAAKAWSSGRDGECMRMDV